MKFEVPLKGTKQKSQSQQHNSRTTNISSKIEMFPWVFTDVAALKPDPSDSSWFADHLHWQKIFRNKISIDRLCPKAICENEDL